MWRVPLTLFAFICFVSASSAPYEGFLRAFPHANISGLLNLKKPINAQYYTYTPPPFVCPTLPPAPDATNVNELKPGNIKVVMAMGDSITAGMSIFDDWIIFLNEYRGFSFSMGADLGIYTLPNFLRISTGVSLVGASTGDSRTHSLNGLNAAVSGAINQDLLEQAQWLVQQLQKSTSINMATDWKLLTVWIGSNNLCDACNDQNFNNGALYETYVGAALQYIFDRVPRVFVNLVSPLDVATLWNIEGAVCATIHAIACPCAGSPWSSDRAITTQIAKDYQVRSYNIAKQFNGKRSDFAVVVQPFLEETIITQRDLVSEADCFHPSAKGHVMGAVALWNNMLTPGASKKKSWNEADVPICPTADSKLYTS